MVTNGPLGVKGLMWYTFWRNCSSIIVILMNCFSLQLLSVSRPNAPIDTVFTTLNSIINSSTTCTYLYFVHSGLLVSGSGVALLGTFHVTIEQEWWILYRFFY